MPQLKNKKSTLIFLAFLLTMGCVRASDKWVVTVKNEHALPGHPVTVTIPLAKLDLKPGTKPSGLLARDMETGIYGLTQLVDLDGDRVKDVLIFQVDMKPHSEKKYELIVAKDDCVRPDTLISTFSRFVPERIDDYAWENDRVAFRTYGPEAERLAKEKLPGGALSSGIDCWLKRVSYPVINRWYKKADEGKGSYHTDSGEGLDNYPVGSSRGCGGIGIWEGDTLYVSDNFTSYKTLETGPLRTVFELEYAPWKAGGIMVKEKKHISLDLGSNLSMIEVQFAPPYPEEIVAGLAIPGKEGKGGTVTVNEKSGWFSFWSGHDGSELGIGIVADPKYISGFSEYRISKAEKSHLFVRLRPIGGKLTYYAGFGWKKSGQFEAKEDWGKYLADFAAMLASPPEIKVEHQ